MKKKELEALLLVLNEVGEIICVGRQNSHADEGFWYDRLVYALIEVLDVFKPSPEAEEVTELLKEINCYYNSLEKRDALAEGTFSDEEDIKWYLRARDNLVADFKRQIASL